ncbi:amino acid ABC transporter substrate-binding protein [Halomonas sp. M4R5S39]|uniref:Amino acid ABC transporter substrate-binding protein n=1 Tax=Halomonas kalidii TaxID=3043293 RepID=A0ABT6VPT6_9GAMM|nr:amino acid ABC transporter substrate-binding protein [Halomonas kalidii]MDI5936008.1 amino acid ABC transporter substrate-binding protein [Halomonas kalidii]MDI5984124.1 amino acid ABC transporter substrate-binding protein [Halomonas kalidii]
MLRSFTLAMLAAGAIAFSGTALAQGETIKVGMSGGYFPFTFVEQDTLKGFEVDVMEAVAEEMGSEVEFVTANFSGLFGMLESGRIDTIANQITITEERQTKYTFTEPYVYDGAQVVVRTGNESIGGVEDLRGRTVAVNLGSNYEQLLRELPYADEIDIRTYDSNIEQDTALGRVDAFVMDRVSASQVIKEKPLPLQLAGEPFSQIRNALPFRDTEADRALRDRVDTALATLREDGTLAEISERWFGTDITRP